MGHIHAGNTVSTAKLRPLDGANSNPISFRSTTEGCVKIQNIGNENGNISIPVLIVWRKYL